MDFGKLLIGFGVLLIIIGAIASVIPLFKLPGDIFIKRGNITFSFPIVTSILLSIILTILLNLFLRR